MIALLLVAAVYFFLLGGDPAVDPTLAGTGKNTETAAAQSVPLSTDSLVAPAAQAPRKPGRRSAGPARSLEEVLGLDQENILRTARAFADALEQAADNRTALKAMGHRGLALAKNEFDRRLLADQWVDWLEGTLAGCDRVPHAGNTATRR